MEYHGSDRREFFRINDTVIMDYKTIDKDQLEKIADSIMFAHQATDNSELSQLRSIHNIFSHLVEQINQEDRNVARALRLLDEKVNIISRQIERYTQPIDPTEMMDVNLSAGGVSLLTQDKIDPHAFVEITIKLLPTAATIHTLAIAVGCDLWNTDADKETYHLRLAFTHMSEEDRNLLVRHTLKRQAEQLRESSQDITETEEHL